MASIVDQIKAVMDAHPNFDPAELRLMVNQMCKDKKKRTNAIQKSMQQLVSENKKASLTRLRRELKAAYEEIHKNDEDVMVVPSSAYRTFVKEQSAILREDIAFTFADQRERMVEIGKRWKAHKMSQQSQNQEDETEQSEEEVEVRPTEIIAPPASRRITRASQKVN